MTLASEVLKAGNTAVVTGCSSGIGRAAVVDFASKGMNIWMLDWDEKELASAKELVVSKKVSDDQKIDSRVVDVSNLDAMKSVAEEVFASGGKCHFLMNNAGIQLGGGALTDIDTVHKVVGVNAFGPIHGCLSFVPKMKEMDEPGIVVNTGSKQGITMPPGNLTYNMSKAALKCYTEGLEHELMKDRLEGGKLKAALLVPGWVNTSIELKRRRMLAANKGDAYDDNECPFFEDKPAEGAWMPPQIISFMIQELDKGRFYIICPDNDVDRETDNIRMAWTMQDITQDRAPLSRWHPDWGDKFKEFLAASKSK